MLRYSKLLILFIMLFLSGCRLFAQFDPHPEKTWYTITTDHFYVHYHNGAEFTANTIAKIAEEVYGPITSLYKYQPDDKVSFVVTDLSDYGNGATDYYGNRIEIYATTLDLDFRFRGTHNWLRNVITHEFTHVVQVQSSMRFSRKMPGIYLQWLNYEEERRPDVLYGYPNVIVSYPLSGVGVPAWYAEGTAQYQRQQMGYDQWDSHRDMVLRMRTLGNNLLTWEEMGQFSSITTYKAETIYNQGLALIRYIAWKYGEDKLREISGHIGDLFAFNVESAFKKSIGKSGQELYNEWKQYLITDYNNRVKNVKLSLGEGEQLVTEGFANYYPKVSPDGKKMSYISNKSSDYGSTSLFVKNFETNSNEELLIAGVPLNYTWSADSKRILFSRRNPANIHGDRVFDIYEYNIAGKSERKLTKNLRAHSPSFSADGTKIVFVKIHDGTQNIITADYSPAGALANIQPLTKFSDGEQVFNPKFTPDGTAIISDYSLNANRKIVRFSLSGEMSYVSPDDSSDYRDAFLSPDGKRLYFASDNTGIFNIYSMNLDSGSSGSDGKMEQLTNVVGGAFMPYIDSKGNLLYSSFQSSGYKINKVSNASDLSANISEKSGNYVPVEKVIEKIASQNSDNSSEPKNKFDWSHLRNFDDKNIPKKETTSYKNVATPLFFIPVLRFDNYTKTRKFADAIKPGLYFYSQDVLGRMGIFGGFSINRQLERDMFLQFQYNNGVPFFKKFFINKLSFVPQFDFAGYNITRKTSADLVAGIDTVRNIEITYDLLQFDFQMSFKIINLNHQVQTGFTYSKYSSKVGQFTIPSIPGATIPASSTNYFTGRDFSLSYTFQDFKPFKNDDINPIGRYFKFKYDYEFNSLNPQLVVNEQGNLVEEFQKANFHRVEGDWAESFSIFNSHSVGFRLKGGSILGPPRDNFFDFYASGFPGMKGYPFYAIGGSRYFTANLTYRFPVVEGLDFRLLQLYFDKIYFSVYGDVGDAWYGKAVQLKDFKKDVGAEIRLQTFSFYVYPTSFAFNAAYGIDQFSRIFPSTTNEQKTVTYGKEWRFYFTILFGFDFFNSMHKVKL